MTRKAVKLHNHPLPPTEVDRRVREEKITLAQLQRLIPSEWFEPLPLRSWLTLCRVLGSAILGLYLLTLVHLAWGLEILWQLPLLGLLWLLQGWVLVGLFVVGHDCGHQSFSRRPWVNALVGTICLAPLANSYFAWRITHNHHHANTQLRGQEVDWSVFLRTPEELASRSPRPSWIVRLGYALPFGIFLWIAWNTIRRGVEIKALVPSQGWETARIRLWLSTLVMGATLVFLYGGLWFLTGWWGMLKYPGIPALIAMLTGSLIITIQHTGEGSLLFEREGWTPVRGQLVSTFDVRFPVVLEFLWCNISLHVPHHIAPGLPCYWLKKASHALRGAYPDYYQSNKFGLKTLLWFKKTPVLQKAKGESYYLVGAG